MSAVISSTNSARLDRVTDSPQDELVALHMPLSLLTRLVQQRHLCLADLRGLDTASKTKLQKLCLNCSAKGWFESSITTACPINMQFDSNSMLGDES